MEETLARVERIIGEREGEGRTALIPLMQRIQGELGYIPPPAIPKLSQALRVPESEIYGVATFYAQFRLEPRGRNLITACRGTACHVRGGAAVRRVLERMLGIKAGETTPDMEYTLETVACIGACALAPTMVINGQVYGQMNAQKVEEMFAERNGGKNG